MTENPALDSLPLAERIDAACDRFEEDWHSGARPQIEEYLATAAESDRPELLRALLPVELELRSQVGQRPQAEEYCGRFPAQSELVRECFAELLASPQDAAPNQTISISSPAADTSVPSSAVPAPTKPLEKLGRFQILKVLGEGAFGTVYRAHDPDLDRPVAIKVPREGVLKTPEDRQRFRREAKAAASFNHPNICPVYEVGEADGHDFIVMGYIDGRPLASYIHSGKTQARQAASVVRKLASALDEAHRQGIVHRDLKPANIMINSRGEPVVMDFGLARLHGPGDPQITASGAIMGSPAYMSPEQARGDTLVVGPASDIYSLGVILYELLAGRRPFQGTVTEVIGQILHVEPAPPSAHRDNVDPRLEAICLKAMAKSPADRHSSMRELAHALADYLKTTVTAAHATDASAALTGSELPAHAKQPARRQTRRIPQVAAGVALAALAVFGGLWFFVRTDTVTVQIHIPIDTKDPTLRFLLDERPLPAAQLGPPIELKPGEHELVVQRDGQIVKHFLLTVGKKNNQISVQDITPKPVVPEGPTPDQRVAEWVLGLGGRVVLRGDQQPISEVDRLPSTPYKVREILLSGKTFPDEELKHLSGLTALQRLDLHATQVSDQGLAHLGSLQGLRYLNLDGSRATDDGLALVKDLRGLEELYLGGSRDISDAGLEHLRGLVTLEALALNSTTVTDRGLEIVKRLPRLRILRLDHTDVTDAGLEHLAGHPQLYELGLGVTGVTGPGLIHLKSLPRLWHLSIAGPQTTDATIEVAGELTQLESLALHQSPRITDNGISHVKALTNLRRLALHETKISDAGLEHLRGLTFLTELSLQQTRVTAAGVARLKAAVPECHIASSLPGSGSNAEVTPKPPVPETPPPAATADADSDADRRAAQWVLQAGGVVTISIDGGADTHIRALADLPKAPFRIVGINLSEIPTITDESLKNLAGVRLKGLNLMRLPVTGAGLVHLDPTSLVDLRLHECKNVTDEGFAAIPRFVNLKILGLVETQITDAVLPRLEDLPRLEEVNLHGTRITDAGVDPLLKLKNLRGLCLYDTKLTSDAVKRLQAGLPKCKVLPDDSPLGSSPPDAAADRKAAEYVLRHGGVVSIKGRQELVRKVEELPASPFKITEINFGGSAAVTDKDISANIGSLTELSKLDFEFTRLSGAGFAFLQGHDRPIIIQNTPTLAEGGNVTDEGVRVIARARRITELYLDSPRITDAGLVHLESQTQIRQLRLSRARITGAGLAHLMHSKDLGNLWLDDTLIADADLALLAPWKLINLGLNGTGITDAGLKHLEIMTGLRSLNVVNTKVTATAVARLHAALPQCVITASLPESNANTDRKAAEWVLSVGGRMEVSVDTITTPVKAAAELPQQRFYINDIRFNWGEPKVSDGGLEHLKGLSKLKTLNLGGIPITDKGIAHLKDLPSLEGLAIDGTRVGDAGLRTIAALTQLKSLTANSIPIKDDSLAHLGNLRDLRLLWLMHIPISDAGIKHLSDLTALKTLALHDTRISDNGLDYLRGLENLRELTLGKTKVTDAGVRSLREALPKCEIAN